MPGQLSGLIGIQNDIFRKMINIENELDAIYFKKYDYQAGVYALDPERKNEQRLHKRQFKVVSQALQDKTKAGLKKKAKEEQRRLQIEKLDHDARDYLLFKVQERYASLPRDSFMDKVRCGILKRFLGHVQTYGLSDIDASKAKVANQAHKNNDNSEEQAMIKQQAVKIGIQKLKQMKDQMDAERKQEEIELNKRLQKDATR